MNQVQIDPKRLARVERWTLRSGSHDTPSARRKAENVEACVMEAVAYVAGEPWSDHPECACPVIGAFLRNWNDSLPDDATRTRLLGPLVPRLVGSKSTPEVELKRSFLALDWLVRVQTPAWLELAGLKDHADLCRQLAKLRDQASCELATETVRGASKAAAAAWAAAWDAAWDAAWAAARAAAGAAAWDAARAAAWAAARAAARAAAGDAAGDAAWDAAWDRLKPTTEQLQASALELLDRMLVLGVADG